jgi:hypothetical protein
MTEVENNADENIWGLIGDVLEDAMQHSVPVSLILVGVGILLFIKYAPALYRLAMAWATRNKT